MDLTELSIVTKINEDFLNSQITETDLFYLEDEELARELVELGYRGTSEIIKREEFIKKKDELAALAEKRKVAKNRYLIHTTNFLALPFSNINKPACFFPQAIFQYNREFYNHEGIIITEPGLIALAAREESNRRGNLSTIIFIRHTNAKGQEISGYVDYAHRLKSEDFVPYFSGKKKLLPRVGDLSFYNWESQHVSSTSTPNYIVIADNPSGLLFKNKRDRKLIIIDPWVSEKHKLMNFAHRIIIQYTTVHKHCYFIKVKVKVLFSLKIMCNSWQFFNFIIVNSSLLDLIHAKCAIYLDEKWYYRLKESSQNLVLTYFPLQKQPFYELVTIICKMT
ncbi:hypothetical protein EGR_00947 [Echinococcus granulosus]|uniref:Cilia- and flagella-associated protein 299 n=1 Tax=Echinococcus granulosus TaxID=6210 RepID=W6USW7_ECHGR|nr:hypothetical protein EGR_00947 [Echinococcus granulosus]EUB64403.1 hypothetical protein EGR_00947 [Echinococcus granulosus]